MRITDLTGMQFGRLLVLGRASNSRNGAPRWHCRCDCGELTVSDGFTLRSGKARSCGCLAADNTRQRSLKHGHNTKGEPSRTYVTWVSMLNRCESPGATSYRNYGGRGIRVCDRWHEFENFLEDMGERPSGKSIDRINNDAA